MAFTRKARRPAHSILSDLSDISLEDSKVEDIRSLKVSRSLTQAASGQSRFLKRNQTAGDKHLNLKENAVLGSGTRQTLGRPLTTASKIRASAALMKLAQIETKIRSRQRARASPSDAESDSSLCEDSLAGRLDRVTPRATSGPASLHTHRTFQKQAREAPSPQSSVQSGQASRFLKKREPPTGTAAPEACVGKERNCQTPRQREPAGKFDSPDSDEEEMKELLGSLMESSREKETSMDQSLTGTKVSEKERVQPFTDEVAVPPRASPLPSAGLSGPSLTPRPPAGPARPALRSARSRTRSPQAPSPAPSLSGPDMVSTSKSSRMGHIQLASSTGSGEPGPGDAWASEASEDSLNDFRINILSLDDLAPADSEISDSEQKAGAARSAGPPGRRRPDGAPAGPEAPRRARPRSSANPGQAASEVGDEGLATESEVSEHLSAPSASAAQDGAAYSEDFESPPSSGASGPAALEGSLATTSECSSRLPTGPPEPPRAGKQRGRGAEGVALKEAAVQTLDPAFTYQWTPAAGMAAIGPALGGAYVDPAPIASHVISADAIEAYSPAVLALNDMLKQQLSLTQQFVAASRHLHLSLLQSTEGDSFHYHSLEEAKEYIRCHRPTPLTMEDALREVEEELL